MVYDLDRYSNSYTSSPVLMIPNTDVNSNTPSISSEKTSAIVDLVYEQYSSETVSSIQYKRLVFDTDEKIFNYLNSENISSGSGYPKNTQPSIVTLDNNYARVVWKGYREYQQEESGTEKQQSVMGEQNVVFRATDNNTHFWTFGSAVENPSINKKNNNSYYAFAWSQSNGASVKMANNTLSSIYTLNHKYNNVTYPLTGTHVQAVNGYSTDFMHIHAFSGSGTAPYVFRYSTPLTGLAKKQNLTPSIAREGIIYSNTAQFYYTFGDIKINGENVSFKDIPDTAVFTGGASVLNYLMSKPFQVTDNSELLYSVQYGIADSTGIPALFADGGAINFRVELVDALTENVLLITDNTTWDSENLLSYRNNSYQVNTTGLGSREVKIRLIIESGLPVKYTLSDKLSEESVLNRSGRTTISVNQQGLITDYSLFQNHPNPFNPETVISYQLPKAGVVTLKVYDILGKEVITLVNEQKESGIYNVSFNAGKLASGVYLYELRVNDYKSVKKMNLLK